MTIPNFNDLTYIPLDIETTGLNPYYESMIEIALVAMKHGEPIQKPFETFINPGRRIPENTIAIHGITDEMVKDAPDIHQVMQQIPSYTNHHLIVCHNAKFDLAFISQAFLKAGLTLPQNWVLDTLGLARMLFPNKKQYNLTSLLDAFRIHRKNAHRAYDDALATGKLLHLFLNELHTRYKYGFDKVLRNANHLVPFDFYVPKTVPIQQIAGLPARNFSSSQLMEGILHQSIAWVDYSYYNSTIGSKKIRLDKVYVQGNTYYISAFNFTSEQWETIPFYSVKGLIL